MCGIHDYSSDYDYYAYIEMSFCFLFRFSNNGATWTYKILSIPDQIDINKQKQYKKKLLIG